MKKTSLILAAACVASPLVAQETRHLDAHEHGVGQLDIAIEGNEVAMELHAPGADIVGFEYLAESAEDLAAIKAAIATLVQPLDLFTPTATAGCSVVIAEAELESELHEDHGHGDHDHEDHAHEDHDDDAHEDHAHEDHDNEAQDDHDDEAHEGHQDAAGHTEFRANYLLSCTDPAALQDIAFGYFTAFPNALELDVQIVSDNGATAVEVERGAPTLDLSSLF